MGIIDPAVAPRLAPYVAVLDQRTPVNFNTASAEVIAAEIELPLADAGGKRRVARRVDRAAVRGNEWHPGAGSLAPGDDFFKKLGIDSLQTLDMLSRLENHFKIELPDYEVQGVSDFRTLAERIQARL